MSITQSQSGFKSLKKNESQVLLTIRNNLGDISRFLREEGIVQQSTYKEVTNHKTTRTNDESAKLVFEELIDKVDEVDEIYKQFVDYLRNNLRSTKTVKMLDDTYAKQGINVKCKYMQL